MTDNGLSPQSFLRRRLACGGAGTGRDSPRQYEILVAAAGSTLTFAIFAVINFGSVLFVRKFCPEARGRSLEELEDDFREHDAAHLVHRPPSDVHGS